MARKQSIYSQQLTLLAKHSAMTVPEVAMAYLVALGWEERDAFTVTGLYDNGLTEEENDKNMKRTTQSRQRYPKIIAKLRANLKTGETQPPQPPEQPEQPEQNIKNRLSKDYQLRELLQALDNTMPGSKEWLDIKKMIADITQAKKEETKHEDTTVHYFLPISCKNCTLYMKEQTKRQQQKQ